MKMISIQVENIEGALAWLKTCPYEYAVSSMQGGFIHIKIFIPIDKVVENK
tara:strand:+ start:84 stop:236 length:153 start_codon:yes stop_codon:yes gene_type:complete